MAKDTATEQFKTSLAHYEQLVQAFPEVERKGKTMPYTSLNGNMFSFIDKEGVLSIRLSAEHREAFIAKYNTELSVQHGRVMKEYVLVPHTLLSNTEELSPYFKQSLDYTGGLKPKATKKK